MSVNDSAIYVDFGEAQLRSQVELAAWLESVLLRMRDSMSPAGEMRIRIQQLLEREKVEEGEWI